MLFTLAYL